MDLGKWKRWLPWVLALVAALVIAWYVGWSAPKPVVAD